MWFSRAGICLCYSIKIVDALRNLSFPALSSVFRANVCPAVQYQERHGILQRRRCIQPTPQCRDQIETNHTSIFTHSSRDPSSPHQRRETFSMPSLSSLLTGLGTLLMMHAAYSCLHYRNMLQDLDLEGSYAIPPMDVYVEVAISFLVLLLGQLSAIGSFQSVEVFAKNHRPVVAPLYRTRDFDIYENRGKVIKSL